MPRALRALPGRFAICRFDPDAALPVWAMHAEAEVWSITRTPHEMSVVCDEDALPPSVERVEPGWVAFAVEGPIPFDETGVIAGITTPLAAAGIGVFVVSTFDTDYVLVRDRQRADAERALAAAGFTLG